MLKYRSSCSIVVKFRTLVVVLADVGGASYAPLEQTGPPRVRLGSITTKQGLFVGGLGDKFVASSSPTRIAYETGYRGLSESPQDVGCTVGSPGTSALPKQRIDQYPAAERVRNVCMLSSADLMNEK